MRTVLVTGATSGIGRATAEELARRGCRVIVHGRDPGRLEEAAEAVRAVGDGEVDTALADFTSLEQVRAMAEDIVRRHDRLDVLVDNAGVYMDRRVVTEDGLEATFQVNVLAPFMLTGMLLPLLERSAPSRIVVVSSATHKGVRRLDLRNLQSQRHFSGYNAYAKSKLGDILITYGLAERLDPARVTANCMHPGGVATKLLHKGFGPGGMPPEQGARTIVYLALSPEVERVTGQYFIREAVAESSPLTHDAELRNAYWERCEQLLFAGVPMGE